MKTSELEERIEKLVTRVNTIQKEYEILNETVDILLERVDMIEDKERLKDRELKVGDKVFIYFEGKEISLCSSEPLYDMISCNHKIGGVIGFYNGEVKVRVGLDKIFFIKPECVIKVEE